MIEEKLRFIELTSDTTFKYMYKNNNTRKWINNIIKKKLGLDLEGFTLIDNELNSGNNKKDYRLDLFLVKDNVLVIIEINNNYYNFLNNKNYQYLYRVSGSRYDRGEIYDNKETKLILINNYRHKRLPELKIAQYVFNEIRTKDRIRDIESYEIYLPNYKYVSYDSDEEDISLSLFSCKNYEEMRKKTNNPEDIKIIEELEKLAMNEYFIFDYDHEKVRKKTENSIRAELTAEITEELTAKAQKSMERAMQKGMQRGRKEGQKEEKVGIAKKMIALSMKIEDISKVTGFTIEEIKLLEN